MKRMEPGTFDRVVRLDSRLRYWVTVPHRPRPSYPLLVSVHGISRNAAEHAHALAPLAETLGVVVVAPLFDETGFPDYQRLGRRGRGMRADLALEAILEDCAERVPLLTDRFFLFGFSGGAQFAHRYALAYPHKVRALAVASAGWYTLPEPRRRFPRGLGPCRHLPDLQFSLPAFLRLPITVMVGERDRARDPVLRRDAELDRRLGRNRFERGRRWVEMLHERAARMGIACRISFESLPRSDHSFPHCVNPARGDLVTRLSRALAGSLPPQEIRRTA